MVLAARNKPRAEEIAKEINDKGGEAFAIETDATDPEALERMASEIENQLGKIDVLINAFGQGIIQPFMDIDPADAKEIIDVNMKVKKDMMLTPEEVADAIFYAVNQPSGSVLNEVVIQPESHQLV